MRSLSIQVQPDRIRGLDIEKTKQLFEALKSNFLVEESAFDEGDDNGRYLNFTYSTNDSQSLWDVIQREIYERTVFGEQLLNCSIAVCSSENGWGSYMLLHHFDPSVPINKH